MKQKPKQNWRSNEAPTYFKPYVACVRCNACGAPATRGAWCASPGCLAERDRYRRELVEFAAKYPEISERLAAIGRGEAPAVHHAREVAA